MKSKINLTGYGSTVFYKCIYPVLDKEFLFGNNYEIFANKVSKLFTLDADQWQTVLNEFELKETILA
jgi:hypothetical protein